MKNNNILVFSRRSYTVKGDKTMWLADKWKEYEVIDCSSGEKLERWGKYILLRPDPQVIWQTEKKDSIKQDNNKKSV